MPFDLQQFQDTFDFSQVDNALPIMQFQAEPIEENDDVVIYQAVIATKEANVNMVTLDDQTLKNIATESNRETAENDIPIHRLHNSREFQIGVMLSGKYEASANRTTGTFNISKDDDTEVLRTRMRLGIVRDMSPKLRGRVKCNVCDERMYVYGSCMNDHWLGDVIKVEGKEIQVTGTYEDAHLIEVSVVARGAFPGAILFSEKEDMVIEAVREGALNEKAIHIISHNYSLDMDKFPKPNPKSTSLPKGDDKKMAKPTDADTQLLKDQNADLTQKVADKDNQIKTLNETTVPKTDFDTLQTNYSTVESERDNKNAKVIELQGKLGTAEVVVSEYEACVNHVRDKAIEFYAKVRGVEVNDTKDHLFVQRKKTLQESKSLPYLIGAYEQYQSEYYSESTEFGGQTTKEMRQQSQEPVAVRVNQSHFDI